MKSQIVFKIVNDPTDNYNLPPPGLVFSDTEGDDTFEMHAFYPQSGGRRVIAYVHREDYRMAA